MKLWKLFSGTADSAVPTVATRSNAEIEQDRLGDELFARVSVAARENPNMGDRTLTVRKMPANGHSFSVIIRLNDSGGSHTAAQFSVNVCQNKLYAYYGLNQRDDFIVDQFEVFVEKACAKVRAFT